MDNIFAPPLGHTKRSESPPAMNSFQKELQSKMKSRQKRGLAADVTPRDSEDSLGSEDELMSGFNMTSKPHAASTWNPPGTKKDQRNGKFSPGSNKSNSANTRGKSPSATDLLFGRKTPTSIAEDEEDDYNDDPLDGPSNLMMTMNVGKKPWTAKARKEPEHTAQSPRFSRKEYGASEDSVDGFVKKEWTPPNMKSSSPTADMNRENTRRNRPKSPRGGRKSPGLSLDSINEDNTPRANPRYNHRSGHSEEDEPAYPRPKPRPRKSRMKQNTDHEVGNPHNSSSTWSGIEERRSPLVDVGRSSPGVDTYGGRETPPSRTTLTGGRHNVDERRTPDSEFKRGTYDRPSDKHNRGGVDDRKSPGLDFERRNFERPSDKKKTERKVDGRNSPTDFRKASIDGRRTPTDGRRTPTDGRRTPTDGRKTPTDDRKTPTDFRKSTIEGRKAVETRNKPFGQKSTKDRTISPEPADRRRSIMDTMAAEVNEQQPKPRQRKTKLLMSDDSDDEDMRRSRSPSPLERGGMRRGPSPVPRGTRSDHRKSPNSKPPSIKERGHSADGDRNVSFKMADRPPSLRNKDRERDDDDVIGSAFKPMPSKREGRSMDRSPAVERDSSVCEEIEKDPQLKRQPTQEERNTAKQGTRSYTRENQILDQAIHSIQDAQSPNTMKFINSDKEEQEREKANQMSDESHKTQKHRPKPRYTKPSPNSPSSATHDFNSTTDIRQAVYEEWYKARQESARKEKKQKQLTQKEQEEKEKKAKLDKLMEAKASYNAWTENKADFGGSTKRKQQRKEEEKLRKKQQDEIQKKKEADQTFRIWKENKDAELRAALTKKQREHQRKLEKEDDDKNSKKKDSSSAFRGWKQKKEDDLDKQKWEKQKQQKKKEEEEKRQQKQREKTALDMYDNWLQNKESQQKKELQKRRRKKMEEEDEDEYQMPWRPASCTVPYGR